MVGGAKEDLLTLRGRMEAENRNELLGKLPPELWQKIIDENLHQNDLFAFAMTSRFFREKQKDLGKKLETNLNTDRFIDPPPLHIRHGRRALRKSERMPLQSLGWFQWVCDTMEIRPGYKRLSYMVKGAVYEGNLVNYAAFQGSVEILRWLVEEKGWEPNKYTVDRAAMGGSVEVLEYVRGRGCKFDKWACARAAQAGRLEALQYLRGLDPPCRWDSTTCDWAAKGGHLEVLKWVRSQDPPCPWSERTCSYAAINGHLEVLKWARSQDPPCPWNEMTCARAAEEGRLDVLKWLRAQNPPCPWRRRECREKASDNGHQHTVEWIDQQED